MDKSQTHLVSTMIYTVLASGFSYMTIYLLISDYSTKTHGFFAFLTGMAVYLFLRSLYKENVKTSRLLAKTYRIFMYVAPLILISVTIIIIYIQIDSAPRFMSFLSGSSIWSSLGNIFIAIGNAVTFIVLLIYYGGIPFLIAAYITIIGILIVLYRSLIELKRNAEFDFSLTIATVQAISPLIVFAVFLMFLNTKSVT